MSTLILDIETIGFDAENQEALSPYKGRITSLGLFDRERTLGSVYFVPNGTAEDFADESFQYKAVTETELLEDFWETAQAYNTFVSFNGRAFDFPFLYMRSLALGVRPSVQVAWQRFVSKQSAPYHVDLFDEYTFYGAVTRKPSLSVLCDAIGIDNPKLALSGEAVTEAFLEKRFTDIARYNAADVMAISELYERWLTHLAPPSFLNVTQV